MFVTINTYYQNYPLRTILFLATALRVIAAIFSRGFGFSDDHFMVIEVAQQWIEGQDHNRWLPWAGNTDTNGPSLLYPGIHYFLFLALKNIGITNPETKMLIVRLLHAFYSLTIVYYGYKITEKISGVAIAKRAGLILATLWLLPMMSVRNAVEVVCIPPLLIATWQLLNAEKKEQQIWVYLWAGFIAGIAFSIRFQTLFFIGGMGLALWMQRKWIQCVWFGVGALVSIVLIQNSIDYTLWGRPFVAFTYYVTYNMANAYNYIVGPWYNYILLFMGLFIPPVSFFIMYGMSKSFKSYLLVIVPALCFFIFHSYFPNKQERFVLPCIPFFVMAGIAGWDYVEKHSAFWIKRQGLLKGCWTFFWSVNIILLAVLTPSASKIARVDAMTYLYKHRANWNTFMVEQSTAWNIVIAPMFYLGEFQQHYAVCGQTPADSVFASIKNNGQALPDYILFAETKDLETRVANIKRFMPNIELEAVIESSYLDKVMFKLNPINAELKYYIYRNKK